MIGLIFITLGAGMMLLGEKFKTLENYFSLLGLGFLLGGIICCLLDLFAYLVK